MFKKLLVKNFKKEILLELSNKNNKTFFTLKQKNFILKKYKFNKKKIISYISVSGSSGSGGFINKSKIKPVSVFKKCSTINSNSNRQLYIINPELNKLKNYFTLFRIFNKDKSINPLKKQKKNKAINQIKNFELKIFKIKRVNKELKNLFARLSINSNINTGYSFDPTAPGSVATENKKNMLNNTWINPDELPYYYYMEDPLKELEKIIYPNEFTLDFVFKELELLYNYYNNILKPVYNTLLIYKKKHLKSRSQESLEKFIFVSLKNKLYNGQFLSKEELQFFSICFEDIDYKKLIFQISELESIKITIFKKKEFEGEGFYSHLTIYGDKKIIKDLNYYTYTAFFDNTKKLELKVLIKLIRHRPKIVEYFITNSRGNVLEKGNFSMCKDKVYKFINKHAPFYLNLPPLILFKTQLDICDTIVNNNQILEDLVSDQWSIFLTGQPCMEAPISKFEANNAPYREFLKFNKNEYPLISSNFQIVSSKDTHPLIASFQLVSSKDEFGKNNLDLLHFNNTTGLIDQNISMSTYYNDNTQKKLNNFKIKTKFPYLIENTEYFGVFLIYSIVKKNLNELNYYNPKQGNKGQIKIYSPIISKTIQSSPGGSGEAVKFTNNLPSYLDFYFNNNKDLKFKYVNNNNNKPESLKMFELIYKNSTDSNIENIIKNYNRLILSKKNEIVKSAYKLLSEIDIVNYDLNNHPELDILLKYLKENKITAMEENIKRLFLLGKAKGTDKKEWIKNIFKLIELYRKLIRIDKRETRKNFLYNFKFKNRNRELLQPLTLNLPDFITPELW